MAPALVNFTLPAAVLCTVVIPGLQDFNISNPSSRVTELAQQSQLATLPDGYIAHPNIGAAYKVYNEGETWTSARKQCISEGAHLAVIDTSVKLDLLMPQLKAERTWTDIHKMHRDTEWVSSNSDLPMSTLPWASGEPSGDNYCVAVSTSPRGLCNFWCINDYPYVCELPIPENYNGQGIHEMVINVTSTPSPESSTLPEGYVKFSDLHTAYKIYRESITWEQARDKCIAEGAHLAVADTVEKIERIYAMKPKGYFMISVGIQKSNTTDDWVRIDNGLPLASIPWSQDNPDDAGDCVLISYEEISLENYSCDVLKNWYVCEISI